MVISVVSGRSSGRAAAVLAFSLGLFLFAALRAPASARLVASESAPPFETLAETLVLDARLDDPPQPLPPAGDADSQRADRARATALVATARRLENAGQLPEALALYQRAAVFLPGSPTVHRAVARLALQQKRNAEAVRHLEVAIRHGDYESTPSLMMYVSAYLAAQSEWDRALDIYARSLEVCAEQEAPPASVARIHLAMARLHRLQEDPQAAAPHLLAVLEFLEDDQTPASARREVLPDEAQGYLEIGSGLLDAGRPSLAQQVLEQLVDEPPGDASEEDADVRLRATCRLAAAWTAQGDAEQAERYLKVYLTAGQNVAGLEPFRLLREILELRGKAGAYIPRLQAITASQPKNLIAQYALAEAYWEADQWNCARELYRDLARTAPTETAFARWVRACVTLEDADELLDALAACCAEYGSLLPIEAADIALFSSPKFAEMVGDAAKRRLSQGIGPSECEAAALVAARYGQAEAAEEFLQRADRLAPNRAAQRTRRVAETLFRGGHYTLATTWLSRAEETLASQPAESADVAYRLASAWAMAGEVDQALVAIDRAISRYQREAAAKVDPGDRAAATVAVAAALNRKALILVNADRQTDAATVYRATLEQFDDLYQSESLRALLRDMKLALSGILVDLGKTEKSERWLLRVLDEFPQHPGALNDLGYQWADRGEHLALAESMIRRAVSQSPDNAAYRDSFGWVLFRRGSLEEALEELKRAVKIDADPVILDHLGEAYAALGRADEAVETWQRAASAFQQGGNTPAAKAVQEKIRRTAGHPIQQ